MIVIWAGGQGNLPLSILLFLLLNTNLVSYVLAAAPTLLAVGVLAVGATQLLPETARPLWVRVGQNLDRYMPGYQMQAHWTWDWAGEPRQNRTEHRVREAEAAVSTTPKKPRARLCYPFLPRPHGRRAAGEQAPACCG